MLIHRGFTGHACRPHEKSGIALHIVIPDALDFIAQQLVLLGTSASQFGLTGFGCMHVITGRSDLDYPTDRLDSVAVTVLVNEGVQGLLRRRGAGQSGSAWAKYALARRRISFALRSSRFSRSRALMRSRSSVVWPRQAHPHRRRWRSAPVSVRRPDIPAPVGSSQW